MGRAGYPIIEVVKPQGFFGQRHLVSLVCFLTIVTANAVRLNMSVAIVAMIIRPAPGNTTNATGSTCPVPSDKGDGGSALEKAGEFLWSGKDQGLILSSFFWGYAIPQIPAGVLLGEYKWSPKWLCGGGLLIAGVLTMLTPIAARAGGVVGLVAVRGIMGFCQGSTYPAVHSVLSKWVVPLERSVLGGFVYAGSTLGAVFTLAVSGLLAGSDILDGWPSVFYFFGVVTLGVFVLWCFFIYDSPPQNPWISTAEKLYITGSLGHSELRSQPSERRKIPWRAVFSSGPFLAILVAHMAQNWGFYTLATVLPTYMKNILHYDLAENGLLSALPYMCMWIFSIPCGVVIDTCRSKKIVNTTQARKIMNTIGQWLPALGLIGVSYTGCDRGLAITMLTLTLTFNGAVFTGFQVNHLDISPNYAGMLMGITNFCGTCCGIVAPYIAGLLIDTGTNLDRWRIVFFIAAGVYLVGNLIYVVFGSGEQQPWNDPESIGRHSAHKKNSSHLSRSEDGSSLDTGIFQPRRTN